MTAVFKKPKVLTIFETLHGETLIILGCQQLSLTVNCVPLLYEHRLETEPCRMLRAEVYWPQKTKRSYHDTGTKRLLFWYASLLGQ